MKLLMVALGGALGSMLRYGATTWAARAFGTAFPWGVLGVNVLGGFVMGLAAALIIERASPGAAHLAPFVMTGILGGFTTFSAFSLDAVRLMESGRFGAAGLYIFASVCASILALAAGLWLARALG